MRWCQSRVSFYDVLCYKLMGGGWWWSECGRKWLGHILEHEHFTCMFRQLICSPYNCQEHARLEPGSLGCLDCSKDCSLKGPWRSNVAFCLRGQLLPFKHPVGSIWPREVKKKKIPVPAEPLLGGKAVFPDPLTYGPGLWFLVSHALAIYGPVPTRYSNLSLAFFLKLAFNLDQRCASSQ